MINETRKIAASTLNAEEDNIVFLDNYVEAVHTALRSCCSKAGGNILIYDFLNNETKKICQFIAHYYEITCIEISTSLSILNSDENLINALIEKLE
jgi:selenocysteine lyase/cysteine desulfurase